MVPALVNQTIRHRLLAGRRLPVVAVAGRVSAAGTVCGRATVVAVAGRVSTAATGSSRHGAVSAGVNIRIQSIGLADLIVGPFTGILRMLLALGSLAAQSLGTELSLFGIRVSPGGLGFALARAEFIVLGRLAELTGSFPVRRQFPPASQTNQESKHYQDYDDDDDDPDHLRCIHTIGLFPLTTRV